VNFCRAKLNALFSTLVVSVAPVFLLPFIPLDHTPERQPLLRGRTEKMMQADVLTDGVINLSNQYY